MEIGLLGDSLQLDDKVTDCCEEFVCRLYQQNSDISDFNKLCYKIFCKTTVKIPSLPPHYDSILHLKRCNYQSYFWKLALIAGLDVESPVGYGWSVTDSGLTSKLITPSRGTKGT